MIFKVFTMQEWRDHGFCPEIGQIIDEEVVFAMRDAVPPIYNSRNIIQVGEAYRHRNDGVAIYATFSRNADGEWLFSYEPEYRSEYKLKRTPYTLIALSMCPKYQRETVLSSSEFDNEMEFAGRCLYGIPELYSQEGKMFDAIVYAHYFHGSTDILITEKRANEMFGYTILNGDYEMAEFGYLTIDSIECSRFELDLYWDRITLKQALKELGYEK